MNYVMEKLWSRPRGVINASYKTINDFESSSEKECSKLDKENEKIYSRLLTQAEKAHSAIRNSGLSMNLEVPIPPRPSNRDRFLLWKKRNVSKKVIEQTEAVIFLEKQGYKYNEHYEAYQAIDLAVEIKKNNGEPIEFTDNSKNFDNVYNKNDRNIFRRRSMYRLRENERLPKDLQNQKRGRNTTSVINPDFSQNQAFEQQSSRESVERLNSINSINGAQQDNFVPDRQYSRSSAQSPLQQNIQYHQSSAPSAPPPSAPQPSAPLSNVEHQIVQLNNKTNSSSINTTPNFSQIETQNRMINQVKPSAPPASNNLRRRNSSFGFDFEKGAENTLPQGVCGEQQYGLEF